MMKQQIISLLLTISVIITTLTACQPATQQADSIIEEKANKQEIVVGEENQKEEQGEDLKPIGLNAKNSIQQAGKYRNYYEIYVASFYDSDGDGIGDLNGVREKLDYIIDMGFTGIWLMPVHPSNTYHKYDVMDYYEIDSDYGTMADMDALIKDCKDRDVALILDLVVNHTADDHPWFSQAKSYMENLPVNAEPNAEDCPYINYYYFTKDSENKPTYYQIGNSPWYYEAVFWEEMPDLNLDHPMVREEIKKIMGFWLNKGIDGFRLDAVKEYYTGKRSQNIEFLQWLVTTAKEIDPEVYLVGEDWDSFREIAEYYKSGIPSLFNFAIATAQGKIAQVLNTKGANHDAQSFVKAMEKIDESFSASNPDYIDALFIANHDHTRVANILRNDMDKMKMAAGMYLTMTGVSFTYYGEEIGMNSEGEKDENKRMPMIWQRDVQTIKPSQADDFEQRAIPVMEQEKIATSLIRYYQKALHLRQEIPTIASGKVKVLEKYSNSEIGAIEKRSLNQDIEENQEIIIFYNLSKETQIISCSDEHWCGEKILGYLSNQAKDIPKWDDNLLVLPPYSITIIKK